MARKHYAWNAVQVYLDEGYDFERSRVRFGFSKSGWNKAIARGKLRVSRQQRNDRRCPYRWVEVLAYYNAGRSYAETAAHFGFSSAAWYSAITRGEITPRPVGMPITELLSNPKRNRSHLKLRLLKAGLLENRCDVCGVDDWRGSL